METALTLHKTYRGITDENCLLWCHGTIGLEHQKVRKFRYPLYKYAHVSPRVVQCVCRNCNMVFYGDYAAGVPLSIPVTKLDSFFETPVNITVGGKRLGLRGELLGTWRKISQQMLTDETRAFIELIQ